MFRSAYGSRSLFEQPIEIERKAGNQPQLRMSHYSQSDSIEGAGDGPGTGNVMVIYALESDCSETKLHERIYNWHPKKKVAV